AGGSSLNAEDNPLSDLKLLSNARPHHAFARANSWDQGTGHFASLAQEQTMHVLSSHASRRRARSMTLSLMSATLGGALVPLETCIDASIPSAAPRIVSPSSIGNDASTVKSRIVQGKTGSGEKLEDEYTDAIELSAPFQLLLVSRRFADIAVRSLWRGIVFHGHDAFQVQSLLSTLCNDNSTHSDSETVVSRPDLHGLDLVKDDLTPSPSPALPSVLDEIETAHPRYSMVDSIQQSVNRFEKSRLRSHRPAVPSGDQRQVPARSPLSTQDRSGTLRRHTTSEVESVPYDSTAPPPSQPHLQQPIQMPRWSYRQLPRNIVLNFAHPQASPQTLVRVLECIGTHCRDQARALDLRANEKMQAAGLESPAELERLFGSGFSRLQYLRLQGGFVDNQLLGALTKSLMPLPTSPSYSEPEDQERDRQQTVFPPPVFVAPPCRLSQVFLGPGSVTDSAIARLIVAARHCLEVFTVTSCVDVGGGALASLLTECPRLKVLAVHKSLARDMELLQGLGFDADSLTSASSPLGAILPDIPSPSRKQIVAPLERLELGSVQLTTTGIAEIIRGVSRTLRFLVLEPRHFKETLLRDVVVPLCRKLEGLQFDDPNHYYQYTLRQQHKQWQQQRQQYQPQQSQPQQPQSTPVSRQPKRRFFKLRRSRRSETPEPQPGVISYSNSHQENDTSVHDIGSSYSGPSPWLGETSTAEWVTFGSCALWAAGAVGSTVGFEANVMSSGNGSGLGRAQSMSGTRGRGTSSFFRGISTRLISILAPNNNSNNTNTSQEELNGLAGTAAAIVSVDHECDVDKILERLGVGREAVEILRQSLTRTLKSFVVMQTDLLPWSKAVADDGEEEDEADDDVVGELAPLDTEEALMRLAVLIIVMAVYESLATVAAQSVLPVEGIEL
ncbi:hypothetical protein BGX29_008202, partial [Mortierella sp. GBA35]